MRELLAPMEPALVSEPFDDPEFLYQVKWDGVRILAVQSPEGVVLWNRKLRLRTRLYPEVCAEIALLNLPVGTVLDGEMVSFGSHGRPEFRRVLRRDLASAPNPAVEVCFVIFDYLHLPDPDKKPPAVFRIPLQERLATLREEVSTSAHVQVTEDYESGTALLSRMQQLELEGIVAKRKDGFYYPGQKHTSWQKVKCWRYVEASAAAIKVKDGRPASLVLTEIVSTSEPQSVAPTVIGRVASGLSQASWPDILAYVDSAAADHNNELVPLRPGIQVTVRFLEWTHQGQLRAPVIESLDFK